VEEIHQQFPAAHIVLAGDFHHMSEADVTDHTGLTSIVYQPTRGANILDRIFVSSPCYSSVRVVKTGVRSDHKAIVAHQESVPRGLQEFPQEDASTERAFPTTPCHN